MILTGISLDMQPVSPYMVKVSIVGKASDEYLQTLYREIFLHTIMQRQIPSFYGAISLSLSFSACHLTRHRV